jgi:ABC-type xylose transport system permease subunit
VLAGSRLTGRLFAGERVRSFGLVAILAVVWIIFQFLTAGLFLTPRNLTVLSVQVAISAILAAGIVMIMVPGHIDLSIGATVSFAAIITAVTMTNFHFSVWPAIVATLLVSAVIGVWHGFWVAVMRVPAFIVTLASLLALRGASLLITSGRTIAPSDKITFISDYSLSPIASGIVLAALWAGIVGLSIREQRARLAAGMEGSFLSLVGIPAVISGALCVAAIAIAFSYRGLPLPVAVLLAIVAVISFQLRYTRFGRHLYAIGGNPEAAHLAGINIRWHSFWVFVAMGFLYGIAGLIFVARLDSAPPNGATGLELNVIAAAVIGGTSLLGGVGRVVGAVLGALLMETLNNGMSLMNLPSYYQQISIGFVLLIAVYLDIRARGRG